MMPPEWPAAFSACLRRINAWRVPPNWSTSEWLREMRAVASCAAWEAECDYDAARGIPFSAFARQRVLSRALTRYRREWAYWLHSTAESGEVRSDGIASHAGHRQTLVSAIGVAIDRLPVSEAWLIRQLYWKERSETEIARDAGITQQAISKRKRVILSSLRRVL
jgi:DNA-directed RNA polymerase specialized sigma subunit